MYDSFIFYGKPLGDESQETVTVKTQVVAHVRGIPEEEPSGTYLNSSGKPHGDIHSTGLPIPNDPTPDKSIIESSNNAKRQRVENNCAHQTNVEKCMKSRTEDTVAQIYECCIGENDFKKLDDTISFIEGIKMRRAMDVEKKLSM